MTSLLLPPLVNAGQLLPYFFGYNAKMFSFQNSPKNLDPSYKTDLDLLGLFRKGKTLIIAIFRRTDLVIRSHSKERKSPSYSRIDTVKGKCLKEIIFNKRVHFVRALTSRDTNRKTLNRSLLKKAEKKT